jgi:hypothetical protein
MESPSDFAGHTRFSESSNREKLNLGANFRAADRRSAVYLAPAIHIDQLVVPFALGYY